ncbi:lasso peptide biosynthesis B2 protein [Streptomyces sp. NPDC018000]|uniref:lasso peptide biosynthesis B2 protein n=1 Tax=Streptomyces sp. NPDC018000 TaxID=3365028 RepID=UPI00379D7A3D
MSTPVILEHRTHLPLHHRVLPLLAVAAATPLVHLRPHRLRKTLELVRRGARPATAAQAHAARTAVVSVNLRCSGQDCLRRSVATALLCRARGTWPTWCTGVRTHPFAAHAWIEAQGHPVGEPASTASFHTLLTVPPR